MPLGLKDAFNASEPTGDGAFLPLVQDPELARLIEVLYPGVEVPPAPRNDLVAIFLTGSRASTSCRTASRRDAPAEHEHRADRLGPEHAEPSRDPGGENDGFPNGRRLNDDVTDIELRALAGATPFTPASTWRPTTS